MKHVLFSLLFFCINSSIHAQYPALEFAKKIGGPGIDIIRDMTIDASQNTVIVGELSATIDFDPSAATATLSGDPGGNIFIAKYDNQGSFLWKNELKGSDVFGNESVRKVATDGAGNIYISGDFDMDIDVNPGAAVVTYTCPGQRASFIAKYSGSGSYLWSVSSGTIEANTTSILLDLDPSGNLYTSWYFGDEWSTYSYVSRLNPTNGQEIWSKLLGVNSVFPRSIKGNNGVSVLGMFQGTVTPNFPSSTPSFVSTGTGNDLCLLNYDANGQFTSGFAVTNPNTDEMGNTIAFDASNNLYIAGFGSPQADFDPSSSTATLSVQGTGPGFIAKYNSSGNFIWAKPFAGFPAGMVVDQAGNIFVAGTYTATADFDAGVGTYDLTPVGGNDAVVAKFSSAGNFIWGHGFGGGSYDWPCNIKIDATGKYYIAGGFNSTADFDPGPNTQNLISDGNDDMFIAKYNQNSSTPPVIGIPEFSNTGSIVHIGPNPNEGNFWIHLEHDANASLHDMSGRLLQTFNLKAGKQAIDISREENGIYFLQLDQGTYTTSFKIVKE